MSNVYAIKHPHGFFKVGRSKNPFSRYERLRTGTPYKTTLHTVLTTDDDAAEVESEIQKKLEVYHWQGEWFNVPEKVLMRIFNQYTDSDEYDSYQLRQPDFTKGEKAEHTPEPSFTNATDL